MENNSDPEVYHYHSLTEEQVDLVIQSFLAGRGESGATEYEISQVVKWADQVALGTKLLEMVYTGKLTIGLRGGEDIVFGNSENTYQPPFKL